MKNLIIVWLLSTCWLQGQTDTGSIIYSRLITAGRMEKNLKVLASDEYEGRETGKRGQKKAAAYIADQFRACGAQAINGNYFQTFQLVQHNPQQISIRSTNQSFQPTVDFFSPSVILHDSSFTLNKITFAGYGIQTAEYNDYQKADTTAKAVMILRGEPKTKANKFILSGNDSESEWSINKKRKIELAKQKGFRIIFIVEENFDQSFQENAHRIYSGRMNLQEDFQPENINPGILVIHISTTMADAILKENNQPLNTICTKISETKQPQSFLLKTKLHINIFQTHENSSAENVVGFVEGSDLKNELVVITAHYDHLGIQDSVVYNGADDDGSGTVAVMELAAAFAKAKEAGNGPRRSILFMTVAGEEKGLLGSDYYSRHPLFPLKQTVANLNIDMIGRIDRAHEGNPDYVYIIGSDMLSSELHQINEKANQEFVQLQLDYTFNNKNDPNRYYYRSDHYNFAKHNIPVIFYFNGVHEDYHQETDEVEKINFKKMEKISRLIFFTAWKLVNQDKRIAVDKK